MVNWYVGAKLVHEQNYDDDDEEGELKSRKQRDNVKVKWKVPVK